MELTPANREFHWISSVEADKVVLQSLHEAMMSFYAEAGERSVYQHMLDDIEEDPDGGSSTTRLADHILELAPESVLEVGCGNGRLFRMMAKKGFDRDYTGVEVAEYVIEQNRNRHPEARWYVADAYELPADEEKMDLVCAEFVLEHLVFPRRALEEMMRVIRPGGHLVLIFPDFVAAGRLSSQILGYSPARTATASLRKNGVLDGIVSLYDGRIRLPSALTKVHEEVGPFPVNVRPACLTYSDHVFPDIDAVYIGSKQEVSRWALDENGYGVEFPKGRQGEYSDTAFISIKKS